MRPSSSNTAENIKQRVVQWSGLASMALALLLLLACTDSALQKLSQAVADVATGTATVQNIVLSANQQNLISTADTSTILGVCAQLNQADAQVSMLIRGQAKLPATSRPTIDTLLKPLVTVLQNALNTGVANVSNPKVKADLTAAFQLIQTGLTAAEIAVSASSSGANSSGSTAPAKAGP